MTEIHYYELKKKDEVVKCIVLSFQSSGSLQTSLADDGDSITRVENDTALAKTAATPSSPQARTIATRRDVVGEVSR
jgi:hypothetical protein